MNLYPTTALQRIRTQVRGANVLRVAFSALVLAALHVSLIAQPTQTDIVYGEAAGEKLLLDVHVPDGDGPFPVAILVHGGGWGSGDKRGAEKPNSGADISPWFKPLTDAKFTSFSINYRLAPKHRWPACFEDVQAAIRWVKAHAAEFKGDPNRIAIFGHSAGGHLAFFAAVQSDESTRVHAAVGYAPVTDFEQELPIRKGISTALQNLHGIGKEITPEALKILRETAPITYVKPGLPPFLILHGDADKTVPLEQSVNFRDRVQATGGTCDLFVIPGAPHRLTEWQKTSSDHDQRMLEWLQRHLDGRKTPSADPSTR